MPPSVHSERDLSVLRSFAGRIDPADASAHNNLGVLYFQKGLTDEAVAEFTHAVDLDPIHQLVARCTGPAGGEEGDGVSAGREAAEDLVQMRLGASGLRIEPILPVEEEELHRPAAPPVVSTSRITASRTPFTKRGLSAVL